MGGLPDADRRVEDHEAGRGQGRSSEAHGEDEETPNRLVARGRGRDDCDVGGPLPVVLHEQPAARVPAAVRLHVWKVRAKRMHWLLLGRCFRFHLELSSCVEDDAADLPRPSQLLGLGKANRRKGRTRWSLWAWAQNAYPHKRL